MIRLASLLVLFVMLGACSGKGDSPTTPAPPAIPNYTGIWTGTYTVTSCAQNGTIALADICGTSVAPGANLPFQLNLVQQGSAIVQGSFTLGGIAFSVMPTTLTSTGAVTVVGTAPLNELTILATWNLATPITGTLSQVWSASTFTGQINIGANIGAVTKTGSDDRPLAP